MTEVMRATEYILKVIEDDSDLSDIEKIEVLKNAATFLQNRLDTKIMMNTYQRVLKGISR